MWQACITKKNSNLGSNPYSHRDTVIKKNFANYFKKFKAEISALLLWNVPDQKELYLIKKNFANYYIKTEPKISALLLWNVQI